MPNTFFASDTHLGHRLMERTRPWDTLAEHDEAIIDNWNSIVRDQDVVYHLGDVTMNRNKLHLAGRLKGRKKLILGNHDTHPIKEYFQYFETVASYKIFDWCIASHIPVHPMELERFGFNVHGHLHSKKVQKQVGYRHQTSDERYVCVSMEQINYFPITLEAVKDRLISCR